MLHHRQGDSNKGVMMRRKAGATTIPTIIPVVSLIVLLARCIWKDHVEVAKKWMADHPDIVNGWIEGIEQQVQARLYPHHSDYARITNPSDPSHDAR